MASILHPLALSTRDLTVTVTVDFALAIFVAGCVLVAAAYLVVNRAGALFAPLRRFEIDEASLGLGNSTLVLRPNDTDRQIAYRIWVELSTRKIGLPIDLEHDVIPEVYDSWYQFFSVTRELIKDIPVQSLRRPDTEAIIRLAVNILNLGLRPHLTRWQARFRHWYDGEIAKAPQSTSPQQLQKRFSDYAALSANLLELNKSLISYRRAMYGLAVARGDREPTAQ